MSTFIRTEGSQDVIDKILFALEQFMDVSATCSVRMDADSFDFLCTKCDTSLDSECKLNEHMVHAHNEFDSSHHDLRCLLSLTFTRSTSAQSSRDELKPIFNDLDAEKIEVKPNIFIKDEDLDQSRRSHLDMMEQNGSDLPSDYFNPSVGSEMTVPLQSYYPSMIHPGSMVDDPDPHCFECKDCYSLFNEEVDLLMHDRECLTPPLNRFKCHLCETNGESRTRLRRHIKTVHLKIKDVICPHCSKGFSRSHVLNVHIKAVHNKDKRFECSMCSFKAPENAVLNTHIKLTHDNVRNHKCQYCDKAYKSKYCLDEHVKCVHDQIKDILCNDCGKMFPSKTKMMRHISLVHRGIKRYKCSHCKRILADKELLKQHLIEEHKGVPNYKCPFCPFSSLYTYVFQKHVARNVCRKVQQK